MATATFPTPSSYPFPNTASTVDDSVNSATGRKTSTSLSTQIIIMVNNSPIGAMQELRVRQARELKRIPEIGTDGIIEIVPQSSATYEISATRVAFDQLKMPEAFQRAFRVIAAQRMPFDIQVIDLDNVNPAGSGSATNPGNGAVVTSYIGCWFTNYETPYTAADFVITETATIWAESMFISTPADYTPTARAGGNNFQTDSAGIELAVNSGQRRGSLDVSGLVNSVFGT